MVVLKEDVIHIWTRRGRELARITLEHMHCNDGDGDVFRSFFPLGELPTDPTGKWTCTTMTVVPPPTDTIASAPAMTPAGSTDWRQSW